MHVCSITYNAKNKNKIHKKESFAIHCVHLYCCYNRRRLNISEMKMIESCVIFHMAVHHRSMEEQHNNNNNKNSTKHTN